MARLYSCGFELQSTTTGMEFSSAGTPGSIDTTLFRSGAASMKFNPSAASVWVGQVFRALGAGEALIRIYVNFTTFPSVDTEIMGLWDSAGVTRQAYIKVSSGGLLKCFDSLDVQQGSNSSALSTGTWYRVELQATAAVGTAKCEAFLDGTSFSTSIVATNSNFDAVYLGTPTGAGTYNMNIDDWAINDTSGANQTGLPGSGKIITLRPSGTGDANAWTRGGTDSGANWSQLEEIPPNDVTDYTTSTTLNQEDLFNMGNGGLASVDTVNVVEVGVRYTSDNAAANPTFKMEIEKTSAGTISQGTGITPNATSWKTNANANPINPTLVLYNDPDASPWTNTTIDSMQAGYKLTTDGTNNLRITSIWVNVDYTPGAVAGVQILPRRMKMGMGM